MQCTILQQLITKSIIFGEKRDYKIRQDKIIFIEMKPWMVEMIQYSTQLVTNYEQVNTVHTYKNINTS